MLNIKHVDTVAKADLGYVEELKEYLSRTPGSISTAPKGKIMDVAFFEGFSIFQ